MSAKAPAASWRNRITGSGEEAPDQLLANAANWRIHPKAQEDAIAGALDQVGWVQQVLVNRRTGFVVDGHARVALALSRGEPTVPVLYVDLSADEEAIVLATLDPIGAMAGRDDEKLRALLADVAVDDAGLLALLGDLGGSEPKAGLTDPDEVPEPPDEPDVKMGELYRLGDHRILCGDATDPAAVARLLDGAAPTLLATDPPYGVQLDQTWRDGVYNGPRKRVKGWGVAAGGAKPYMMRDAPAPAPAQDGATTSSGGGRGRTKGYLHTSISGDVRADWSEAFALVPSLEVGYVWYASAHTLDVLQGLVAIGFEFAAQIIWDKGLFSIGRSWYHWNHEPCFVVRKPGLSNLFIGEHDQATIWRAPSPKRIGSGSRERKEDHPTQRPIVLSEIPIRNHLRPGEAVYEPFSGSGTTLMAAETLGRRCYAMEVDPKYVQVAIERWERFTGLKAERVDG
jgi:DNA modification methylase